MVDVSCADSGEKHEPASDIDAAAVESLKALDPSWPIREADSCTAAKKHVRTRPAVSVRQRPQVLPFLDRQLNEGQYSATDRSVRIVERFTHLQVIVVRGFNQFDGLCYWIRPWSTCSPFPLIGFAHSTRKLKLLLRLSAGLLSRSAERRRQEGQ